MHLLKVQSTVPSTFIVGKEEEKRQVPPGEEKGAFGKLCGTALARKDGHGTYTLLSLHLWTIRLVSVGISWTLNRLRYKHFY